MARIFPPLAALGPLAAVGAMALTLSCAGDGPTAGTETTALSRAGYDVPGAHRQYGTPVRLGNGRARTYVVLDQKDAGRPLEIGIALDASLVASGLPTEMRMMALPMPAQAPAPYEFALFDWNPQGHIPLEAYGVPHFDFHFYLVPHADVMAILPTDPDFAAEADDLPAGDEIPPFYIVPGPSGAAVAVPGMGVHWSDVRSPELQGLLGNPAGYQPFTKTFIYGSWAGRFTFLEPMITRAYLLTHPDEIIAIPQPAQYPEPGWYPDSYRITYDAQAREYRIALTGLTYHE